MYQNTEMLEVASVFKFACFLFFSFFSVVLNRTCFINTRHCYQIRFRRIAPAGKHLIFSPKQGAVGTPALLVVKLYFLGVIPRTSFLGHQADDAGLTLLLCPWVKNIF